MVEHAHDPTVITYLTHGAVGAVFAASGAYAQQFCEHFWHRIVVGGLLVAAETAIIVPLVG